MTLTEIYKQQKHELEQFKALRDKAWFDLQKEQQEITIAFGGRDKLPDDMQQRFAMQIDSYHNEWALETGQRFQEIQQLHEKQREALTGVKQPKNQPLKSEQPSKPDQLTEKQIDMQKIIRQQQAIRQRQQEKKRKR